MGHRALIATTAASEAGVAISLDTPETRTISTLVQITDISTAITR